jgi:lysophospholipase L1-like esterase
MEAGARYVAMGSSFAAGPGLTPRVLDSPRPAGRSASNYAHLVAAKLALDLHDVTFSGATTTDLLAGGAAAVPQVDAVGSDTKLVTITGGGNDVGYLPGLTLASLPGVLKAVPSIRRRSFDSREPGAVTARFVQLDDSARRLVREVHRRAPEATILLVDYLTILPPDSTTVTSPLPVAVAEWGRSTASRLTALLSTVAAEEGAVFVAAGAASIEHHAWSADPWTRRFHYSLRGGAPYHPNLAGMRAVARMVVDSLG